MAYNKYSTSSTDTWSMDAYFLFDVQVLIQKYIDSDFLNDLDGMYKSCKNLAIIISPKVGVNPRIDQDIKWLKENMDRIYVVQEGKVKGMNNENLQKVKNVLDDLFRYMLGSLEDAGIYSKKGRDPGKAAGNFGGS